MEKDAFVVPELYYEYGYNEDNTIVETYRTPNGIKEFSFEFGIEKEKIYSLRDEFFEANNCSINNSTLIAFKVPKEEFDKALKAYGLK